MVFLMKKAAIIAAIITILGLFFMEMRSGRPSSNFTNPRIPCSSHGSSQDCNCLLITNCLSSLKNNQTPRFCGFEGIQRKICCDPGDEGTPADSEIDSSGRANAFLNTAQLQSQAAKFYRNQFLYNNERIGGKGYDSRVTLPTRTTSTTTSTPTTTRKPSRTRLTTSATSTTTEKPKESRKLPPDQDDQESLKNIQKNAGSFLAEYFPEYYNDLVKNLTQFDNVTFIEDIPVPKEKTSDTNSSESVNETEAALKRLLELNENLNEFLSTTPSGSEPQFADNDDELNFENFDLEQFLNITGFTTSTSTPTSTPGVSLGSGSGDLSDTTIKPELQPVFSASSTTQSSALEKAEHGHNDSVYTSTELSSDDVASSQASLTLPATTTISEPRVESVDDKNDFNLESLLNSSLINDIKQYDESTTTVDSGIAESIGQTEDGMNLSNSPFVHEPSTMQPSTVDDQPTFKDITATPSTASINKFKNEEETLSTHLSILETTRIPELTSTQTSVSGDNFSPKFTTPSNELELLITTNNATESPNIFRDTTTTLGNLPEHIPSTELPLEEMPSSTKATTHSFDELTTSAIKSFGGHEIPDIEHTTISPSSDFHMNNLTSTQFPKSAVGTMHGETTHKDELSLDNSTTTKISGADGVTYSTETPETLEISPTTEELPKPMPTLELTTKPVDKMLQNSTFEDVTNPDQISTAVPSGHSLLQDDQDVDDADLNDVEGPAAKEKVPVEDLGAVEKDKDHSQFPTMENPTTTTTSTTSTMELSSSKSTIEATTVMGEVVGRTEMGNLHPTTPTYVGRSSSETSEQGLFTSTLSTIPKETTTPISAKIEESKPYNTIETFSTAKDDLEDMISTTELSPENTNIKLLNKHGQDGIDILNKEVKKQLNESEVTTLRPEISSITIFSNIDNSTDKIQSQQTTPTTTTTEQDGYVTRLPEMPFTQEPPSPRTRNYDKLDHTYTTTESKIEVSPTTTEDEQLSLNVKEPYHGVGEMQDDDQITTTAKYFDSSMKSKVHSTPQTMEGTSTVQAGNDTALEDTTERHGKTPETKSLAGYEIPDIEFSTVSPSSDFEMDNLTSQLPNTTMDKMNGESIHASNEVQDSQSTTSKKISDADGLISTESPATLEISSTTENSLPKPIPTLVELIELTTKPADKTSQNSTFDDVINPDQTSTAVPTGHSLLQDDQDFNDADLNDVEGPAAKEKIPDEDLGLVQKGKNHSQFPSIEKPTTTTSTTSKMESSTPKSNFETTTMTEEVVGKTEMGNLHPTTPRYGGRSTSETSDQEVFTSTLSTIPKENITPISAKIEESKPNNIETSSTEKDDSEDMISTTELSPENINITLLHKHEQDGIDIINKQVITTLRPEISSITVLSNIDNSTDKIQSQQTTPTTTTTEQDGHITGLPEIPSTFTQEPPSPRTMNNDKPDHTYTTTVPVTESEISPTTKEGEQLSLNVKEPYHGVGEMQDEDQIPFDLTTTTAKYFDSPMTHTPQTMEGASTVQAGNDTALEDLHTTERHGKTLATKSLAGHEIPDIGFSTVSPSSDFEMDNLSQFPNTTMDKVNGESIHESNEVQDSTTTKKISDADGLISTEPPATLEMSSTTENSLPKPMPTLVELIELTTKPADKTSQNSTFDDVTNPDQISTSVPTGHSLLQDDQEFDDADLNDVEGPAPKEKVPIEDLDSAEKDKDHSQFPTTTTTATPTTSTMESSSSKSTFKTTTVKMETENLQTTTPIYSSVSETVNESDPELFTSTTLSTPKDATTPDTENITESQPRKNYEMSTSNDDSEDMISTTELSPLPENSKIKPLHENEQDSQLNEIDILNKEVIKQLDETVITTLRPVISSTTLFSNTDNSTSQIHLQSTTPTATTMEKDEDMSLTPVQVIPPSTRDDDSTNVPVTARGEPESEINMPHTTTEGAQLSLNVTEPFHGVGEVQDNREIEPDVTTITTTAKYLDPSMTSKVYPTPTSTVQSGNDTVSEELSITERNVHDTTTIPSPSFTNSYSTSSNNPSTTTSISSSEVFNPVERSGDFETGVETTTGSSDLGESKFMHSTTSQIENYNPSTFTTIVNPTENTKTVPEKIQNDETTTPTVSNPDTDTTKSLIIPAATSTASPDLENTDLTTIGKTLLSVESHDETTIKPSVVTSAPVSFTTSAAKDDANNESFTTISSHKQFDSGSVNDKEHYHSKNDTMTGEFEDTKDVKTSKPSSTLPSSQLSPDTADPTDFTTTQKFQSSNFGESLEKSNEILGNDKISITESIISIQDMSKKSEEATVVSTTSTLSNDVDEETTISDLRTDSPTISATISGTTTDKLLSDSDIGFTKPDEIATTQKTLSTFVSTDRNVQDTTEPPTPTVIPNIDHTSSTTTSSSKTSSIQGDDMESATDNSVHQNDKSKLLGGTSYYATTESDSGIPDTTTSSTTLRTKPISNPDTVDMIYTTIETASNVSTETTTVQNAKEPPTLIPSTQISLTFSTTTTETSKILRDDVDLTTEGIVNQDSTSSKAEVITIATTTTESPNADGVNLKNEMKVDFDIFTTTSTTRKPNNTPKPEINEMKFTSTETMPKTTETSTENVEIHDNSKKEDDNISMTTASENDEVATTQKTLGTSVSTNGNDTTELPTPNVISNTQINLASSPTTKSSNLYSFPGNDTESTTDNMDRSKQSEETSITTSTESEASSPSTTDSSLLVTTASSTTTIKTKTVSSPVRDDIVDTTTETFSNTNGPTEVTTVQNEKEPPTVTPKTRSSLTFSTTTINTHKVIGGDVDFTTEDIGNQQDTTSSKAEAITIATSTTESSDADEQPRRNDIEPDAVIVETTPETNIITPKLGAHEISITSTEATPNNTEESSTEPPTTVYLTIDADKNLTSTTGSSQTSSDDVDSTTDNEIRQNNVEKQNEIISTTSENEPSSTTDSSMKPDLSSITTTDNTPAKTHLDIIDDFTTETIPTTIIPKHEKSEETKIPSTERNIGSSPTTTIIPNIYKDTLESTTENIIVMHDTFEQSVPEKGKVLVTSIKPETQSTTTTSQTPTKPTIVENIDMDLDQESIETTPNPSPPKETRYKEVTGASSITESNPLTPTTDAPQITRSNNDESLEPTTESVKIHDTSKMQDDNIVTTNASENEDVIPTTTRIAPTTTTISTPSKSTTEEIVASNALTTTEPTSNTSPSMPRNSEEMIETVNPNTFNSLIGSSTTIPETVGLSTETKKKQDAFPTENESLMTTTTTSDGESSLISTTSSKPSIIDYITTQTPSLLRSTVITSDGRNYNRDEQESTTEYKVTQEISEIQNQIIMTTVASTENEEALILTTMNGMKSNRSKEISRTPPTKATEASLENEIAETTSLPKIMPKHTNSEDIPVTIIPITDKNTEAPQLTTRDDMKTTTEGMRTQEMDKENETTVQTTITTTSTTTSSKEFDITITMSPMSIDNTHTPMSIEESPTEATQDKIDVTTIESQSISLTPTSIITPKPQLFNETDTTTDNINSTTQMVYMSENNSGNNATDSETMSVFEKSTENPATTISTVQLSTTTETKVPHKTNTTVTETTTPDESTTNTADEGLNPNESSSTFFPTEKSSTITTQTSLIEENSTSTDAAIQKLNDEIIDKLNQIELGFNMSTTTESSNTDRYLETPISTTTTPSENAVTTVSTPYLDTSRTTLGPVEIVTETSLEKAATSKIPMAERTDEMNSTPSNNFDSESMGLSTTMKNVIGDILENSSETVKPSAPFNFMLNITEIFPETALNKSSISDPAKVSPKPEDIQPTSMKPFPTSSPISVTTVNNVDDSTGTVSSNLKNNLDNTDSPSGLTPAPSTESSFESKPISSTSEITKNDDSTPTTVPPQLNDLEFVPDYPEQFMQNDFEPDSDTHNATDPTIIIDMFTTEIPKQRTEKELNMVTKDDEKVTENAVSNASHTPMKMSVDAISDGMFTTRTNAQDATEITTTSSPLPKMSSTSRPHPSSSESPETTPSDLYQTTPREIPQTTPSDSPQTTLVSFLTSVSATRTKSSKSSESLQKAPSESPQTTSSENPQTTSTETPETIVSFILSISATRTKSSKSKSFTETATQNITYELSLNHTRPVPSLPAITNTNTTPKSYELDEVVFDENTSTNPSIIEVTTDHVLENFTEVGTNHSTSLQTTNATPEENSTVFSQTTTNISPEESTTLTEFDGDNNATSKIESTSQMSNQSSITELPTTTSNTQDVNDVDFDEKISTFNPLMDVTTSTDQTLDISTQTNVPPSVISTTSNATPEEISTMSLLEEFHPNDAKPDNLNNSVSPTGKQLGPSDEFNVVFDDSTSTLNPIPSIDTTEHVFESISETNTPENHSTLLQTTTNTTPENHSTLLQTTTNTTPEDATISSLTDFNPLHLDLDTTNINKNNTDMTTAVAKSDEISKSDADTESNPSINTVEKVLPINATSPDEASDFADLFTSHSKSNPNSSLILDIITGLTSSSYKSHNSTTSTISGESSSTKSSINSLSQPNNKTEEEISLIISTGRGNRSLTNNEAIDLAKELGSQISNVVNQLLLTTHKKFYLLPLFTECANAKRPRKKSRVLNLEYEHLPHVVRIGALEPGGLVYSCAGTLISKRYVLTSAQCLQNKFPITTTLIEDDLNNKYYVDIESITLHSKFSNLTLANDIALVRLKQEQTEIKPICLPFEDAYGIWESIQQNPGDTATLSGWTKKSKPKRVDMDETTVDIIPERNCSSLFKSSDSHTSQICTTSPIFYPNYFTRGSPLTTVMTRHKLYFQIGLLSNYNINTQYHTRITTYLQWILDSIEE